MDPENFGKLFLSFFLTVLLGIQHLGSQNSGRMECRKALSMRSEGDNSVTIPCPQYGVEIKVARASFSMALRV